MAYPVIIPLSIFMTCIGFDFISKFGMDTPDLSNLPGVKAIQGSNEYQRGFQIQKSANLRIPTRSVDTAATRSSLSGMRYDFV